MPYRSEVPRMIRLSSVEYCAAAMIFIWGLWVLFWGEGGALSAPAFITLRAQVESWGLGPPYRPLGLLGMFVGAFYALAIRINGKAVMWTPLVRGNSCIAAVIFLLHLVVSIYDQQPSSTGVLTYGALSVGYFGLFVANLDRFAHSLELIWERACGLVTK